MQTHRPSLTHHQLRRFALWTLVMLQWIAAMLSGEGLPTHRQMRQRIGFVSLPWLKRRVGYLLIIRAAQLRAPRRLKRQRFWRYGRDFRRAHIIRTVLGARTRGALTHRNAVIWIAKLIHVLRNLDAYARPLIRRLNGGLTRLTRVAPAIAPASAICAAPVCAPGFADSS